MPTVLDAASHADSNIRIQPYDYVVVCTKQLPDVYSVAELIRPVVTPGHTSIVLIQNGLDIEVPLIAAFPTNAVISGVSMIGSRISDPNRVIHSSRDELTLGAHFHAGLSHAAQLARAQAFVELYAAGGAAECSLAPDMPAARWRKLLWNATFNTLCALMRVDVGELQASRGRESLLLPMMWEVHAIARAAGCVLPEDVIPFLAYRLPDDCRYRPSMLLDLENGRPMELEVILGNPLKRAKELGVDAPILSTVYELLKLEKWKMEQELSAKTPILNT